MSEVLHMRRIPRTRVKLIRVRTPQPVPNEHHPPVEEAFTPFHEPPAKERVQVQPPPVHEQGESLSRAYTRGVEEGQRIAEAEFNESLVRLRADEDARIGQLLGSISAGMTALQRTLEQDAYRFAVAVAERIVKREITLTDDVVVAQIKEAVHRIVGVESIKLRVHPSDEGIVRAHRTAFLSSLENVRDLVVETDDGMERGGCIIESASGNVDARISTQLRQIEASLFGVTGGSPEVQP